MVFGQQKNYTRYSSGADRLPDKHSLQFICIYIHSPSLAKHFKVPTLVGRLCEEGLLDD